MALQGQDLEKWAAHPHQEFLGISPLPWGLKKTKQKLCVVAVVPF